MANARAKAKVKATVAKRAAATKKKAGRGIRKAVAGKGRTSAPALNPLLTAWTTPFEMPPFDRVAPEHFLPAFTRAFAANIAEVEAIVANRARPTFENTIEALERTGRLLDRVSSVLYALAGADTNEAIQAIERKIAPRFAKHHSRIFQDSKLFKRVDALMRAKDELGLTEEQMRVLERYHRAFIRAGAGLTPKARERMAAIGERLATLATRFNQNVLADEQAYLLVLDSEDELAGLPEAQRAAAARTAAERGHKGKHAISLARSSIEPFLQLSARRDLREQAYKAWRQRGANGGKTDNRKIIAEILALRAERSRMLGYNTFAEASLELAMAKTPAAVRKLLMDVWKPAKARAAEERADLDKAVLKEGGNFQVEGWDWRYYTEKVRKAKLAVDETEVKAYLQLDNVIAAAFDCANRLFGVSFKERTDLPVYNAEVRGWEVVDKDGQHMGLFLGDYFARPSKRSGAWMSGWRRANKLDAEEVRPIVVNVLNLTKGAPGEPALLSIDDARTLFHEFGHALHGLLTRVTYPSVSGTSVERDFVELPSQLYEHWFMHPDVLKRFARHYKTGKPLPASLLNKIKAARNFNQGFATVEYTAAALVDLELHTLEDPDQIDVDAFEAETLARLGAPAEIGMRHRIPHFQHIIGGYASGYYSYMWSEVMDADAFSAFEEAGDIFDAKLAKKLHDNIYAAGGTRDPAKLYKAFRGRQPKVKALLEKRGLAA